MIAMRAMAFLLLPLLAACAGSGEGSPATPPALSDGPCRNEGLDRFVGQKASADIATQMLAASGARTLRWAPPGMAMTMDFRPDRLTVSYDAKMAITSARCG